MRARRAVAGAGLLTLVATGCSDDVRRGDPEPRSSGSATSSPPTSGAAPSEPRGDVHGPLAAALAGRPTPPRSPRQVAAQLVAADRVIGDPASPRALLAAAGHTQQLAYRELADHPAWDDPVRGFLPRALRQDTAANVAARRAFRSMHPTNPRDLADELPAWRIVRPRPAAELRRYYRTAERRYGVEWEYLAAIHLVETAFGRIDGTSVAGAQGPMQFIPTTWDIYGEGGDIEDPRDAILAAARLLNANGFARDPAGALYRYNNSTAYVRGVSLYAEVMQRTPRAFLGYHQWPVYYLTRRGAVWLPVGYAEREPVPVREWLARH
ncbi:MAG TPA: transglycosylase SLT domain-containing protein [Nocardioides sp.]|nr:transglycosylase SLT domain-containing protein [Nocardioides sp.]